MPASALLRVAELGFARGLGTITFEVKTVPTAIPAPGLETGVWGCVDAALMAEDWFECATALVDISCVSSGAYCCASQCVRW